MIWTLTAVTQDKNILFFCFDLLCRIFWIPTPCCSCRFYWHYEIYWSFWALFFLKFFIAFINVSLLLRWAFEVLWSFPFIFLLSFFNFSFSFFLTYYYYSTFVTLFAFLTVLFPLQLIININKSSLSTSVQLCISILSFFPFLSKYVSFSCFIPQLESCSSFVFQFVL